MKKKYSLILFIFFPIILFSQTNGIKGEPYYPDSIWNIKQFKRVKDLSNRKKIGNNSNRDWARWEEWRKLKNKTSEQRSSALGDWINYGPNIGSGRIISIAFHPTDSNTFYVGAASGGLWKTTDYGDNWQPLTDDYPSMAIGAIGINPLNPSKMIIVTGEGYIAVGTEMTFGIGILVSNDAGLTWDTTNVSANLNQVFAGLDVYWSETDTNNVCVATTWGIMHSNDGGNNFVTTLSVLPSRMVSDPQNPDTLYLTTRYFNNTVLGGFYKSYDGGMTWTEILGTGLPSGTQMGFSSIAVHPVYPNIIYINVSKSTLNGVGPSVGLYKSTDYGNTFSLIPTNLDVLCYSALGFSYCLGWYSNTILLSTTDTSTLFAGGIRLWKSTDGGSNWVQTDTLANGNSAVHSDHHQTVYHPITGDLFDINDGGVDLSTDQGATWNSISDGLITYQYYSISVSEMNPEVVIGGTQDMGITYSTDIYSPNSWNYLVYGDVFSTAIDYTNPSIWYATVFPVGGRIKTFNSGANWWVIENGITNGEQWRTALTMHPNTPTTLLTASATNIYKSTDATNWTSKANFGNISKIVYDKVNPNIVYTNTLFGGDVHQSTDGGESWNTLFSSPGSPITDLETDPNLSGIIYATVGSFSQQSQIYKSVDFGVSWTNISNNLPSVPANTVVIDPFNTTNIYIGTDLGVWFSNNGGDFWQEFNRNLPYVAVEDMHFLKADTTIRIGTYGRGYWESKAVNTGSLSIVDNTDTQRKIVAFPNPTTGIINLLNFEYKKETSFSIFDVLGNKIGKIEAVNNTLDITHLSSGIYLLKIIHNKEIQIVKIIKQ